MAEKLQMIMHNAILVMKIGQSGYLVIEVCTLGCDWWEVIIGLDNGLVVSRQQATT